MKFSANSTEALKSNKMILVKRNVMYLSCVRLDIQ